jgi:hypothetical protein
MRNWSPAGKKMNRVIGFRRTPLAKLGILAGLLFSTHALAQEEGSKVTSMKLGFDVQQPGHEVFIPLILDVPDGVEVDTAISEVTFPNKLLSFNEVASGLSAQAVSAEVRAGVEIDEQNPEDSIVTVTVSTPQGQSIPSGVIADLAFTISEDAAVEQTIKLKNVVRALNTDEGPVEPIMGTEGEVQVTANPPIFACFFYMH